MLGMEESDIMGEWIGTIGGAMMIVLIIALFLRFLSEMGWIKQEAELRKWLPRIAGIGLVELLLCGVYYTTKVNGTSLLDLGTIWAEHPLLLRERYPLNWYLSMVCGVITYWNVYQILRLFVGDQEAENGLYCSLAVPGSYLLFLPFRCSFLGMVMSLVCRLLLSNGSAGGYQKCKEAMKPIWQWLGSTGYLCMMSILVILNGASVIILLGV